MITMESNRKILNRHRRGDGIRQIARDLNISRNKVRDVIRSFEVSKKLEAPSYNRTIQHYPALEGFIPILEKLL